MRNLGVIFGKPTCGIGTLGKDVRPDEVCPKDGVKTCSVCVGASREAVFVRTNSSTVGDGAADFFYRFASKNTFVPPPVLFMFSL